MPVSVFFELCARDLPNAVLFVSVGACDRLGALLTLSNLYCLIHYEDHEHFVLKIYNTISKLILTINRLIDVGVLLVAFPNDN